MCTRNFPHRRRPTRSFAGGEMQRVYLLSSGTRRRGRRNKVLLLRCPKEVDQTIVGAEEGDDGAVEQDAHRVGGYGKVQREG